MWEGTKVICRKEPAPARVASVRATGRATTLAAPLFPSLAVVTPPPEGPPGSPGDAIGWRRRDLFPWLRSGAASATVPVPRSLVSATRSLRRWKCRPRIRPCDRIWGRAAGERPCGGYGMVAARQRRRAQEDGGSGFVDCGRRRRRWLRRWCWRWVWPSCQHR
jgi:hypothetical protein